MSDYVGKTFSYLTVLSKVSSVKDSSGDWHSCYLCKCKCGAELTVTRRLLRKGKVQSCGCLKYDNYLKRAQDKWLNRPVSSSATITDVFLDNNHVKTKVTCLCGYEAVKSTSSLNNWKFICPKCNPHTILVGHIFGQLTVIEKIFAGSRKKSGVPVTHYRCICTCGKEVTYSHGKLHRTKHCGCVKHIPTSSVYVPGQRFGKLVVIEFLGGNTIRCKCDCGEETLKLSSTLGMGLGYSCGCDVAAKREVTMLARYGVTNPSQSPLIKKKKEATCLANHGVSHPSQSPDIKRRQEQTCFKNYGVKHPSQNRDISQKQAKRVNDSKSFIHWKTGTEIITRGSYESRVIEFLNAAEIDYAWQIPFKLSSGKVYLCDLYLIDLDLYIEIKGWWRDDAKDKWDLFREDYPNLEAEVWMKDQLQQLTT